MYLRALSEKRRLVVAALLFPASGSVIRQGKQESSVIRSSLPGWVRTRFVPQCGNEKRQGNWSDPLPLLPPGGVTRQVSAWSLFRFCRDSRLISLTRTVRFIVCGLLDVHWRVLLFAI